MASHPHPALGLTMDQTGIIVSVTAALVLCTIPTVMLYMAFATHRSRQAWRAEAEKQMRDVRDLERRQQSMRYDADDRVIDRPRGTSRTRQGAEESPRRSRGSSRHGGSPRATSRADSRRRARDNSIPAGRHRQRSNSRSDEHHVQWGSQRSLEDRHLRDGSQRVGSRSNSQRRRLNVLDTGGNAGEVHEWSIF